MGGVLPFDGVRGLLKPGAGPQTINPAYFAVPNGLVGYWGFDPDCLDFTNGLALDLSGNGNTGTLTGSPTLGVGQIDGALKFTGSQLVDLTNTAAIKPTASITVAAWIKPSSTAVQMIFDNEGAAPYFGVAFYLDGSNHVNWEVYIGGDKIVVSAGTVPLDAWSHVTGIYDGAKMRIYINGAADANTASASGAITNSTLASYIGGFSATPTSYHFNGSIDDVRVYNRGLDPWEVIQLYQAGLSGRRDAGALLPQACEMETLRLPFLPQWAAGVNSIMSSGARGA